MQNTLCIIKPDGFIARELIIKMIEDAGLEVARRKEVYLSEEKAKGFYADHKGKGFFEDLISYMTGGVILVIELSGENAVETYREVLGATNPKEADSNSIRYIFGKDIERNAAHGSDSEEAAEREINFFFGVEK